MVSSHLYPFFFVYGMKKCPNHVLLYVGVPGSLTEKTVFFSFDYFWFFCCRLTDYRYVFIF